MVIRRTTPTLFATALLIVACSLAALVLAAPAEPMKDAGRGTLTVRSSEYGRVFVLYGFTADKKRRSVCAGACATAWPPYLVERAPRAGRGVTESLLGTIRRAGGKRQVTYAGRPLYYYVGDRRPARSCARTCSSFGGDWLVVRPSGDFVR